MAAITTIYPTDVPSSKAAEIHRQDNGKIFYVCFHCGFNLDNIDDTLSHIEFHFSSPNAIKIDEEPLEYIDIKYELLDDASKEEVNSNQLEEIFIDCSNKSILKNEEQSFRTDDDEIPLDEQTLSMPTEIFSDLDGLFEWKCLHCSSLVKNYAKLKRHMIKHTKIERNISKGQYSFKCTLCTAEFYDPTSSRQHLNDSHKAVPTRPKLSSEKRRQVTTVHTAIAPVKTNQRNDIEAEMNEMPNVCILCDKLFTGPLNFMEHTFVHFNLRIFSCPECPAKFNRMYTIKDHVKKKHSQSLVYDFRCRFCNVKVDDLLEFVMHTYKYHLDDGDRNNSDLDATFNYDCRFCEKNFTRWDDAKKHLTIHGNDELPNFSPKLPIRSFSDRCKSGTYRAEFLYNCSGCMETLCGSFEARKHSITEHKQFKNNRMEVRILLSKKDTVKERLKCYECDSILNSQLSLMKHRLIHFNVAPYSCSICSKTFNFISNVNRHAITKHNTKPDENNHQFNCHYCKADFIKEIDFITHMFNDHLYVNFDIYENLDGQCKYECAYCKETIMERTLMDKHLEMHENKEIPPMHAADSVESSMNALRHNVEFMYCCLQCPKKFRIPQPVLEHIKYKHKIQNNSGDRKSSKQWKNKYPQTSDLNCYVCNVKFLTWRSMINHQAKLHPEPPDTQEETENSGEGKTKPTRTLEDPVSKRKTENKQGFKTAITRDTYCDICKAAFSTLHSMINHRSKRHPETHNKERYKNSPTYHCTNSFCGKTFRSRSNFLRHEETHTKPNAYICDICNKHFSLKTSLRTHMYIHTNEKNFVCFQCGKSFYTVSKLNLHNQIHENLTLPCDQCDKVFFTRNNYSKHKKRHTDVARKKCKLCNNTFKSSVSLRIHMLLHSGEKKYSCRYCDMTFAQSSGRRGHERSKHDATDAS